MNRFSKLHPVTHLVFYAFSLVFVFVVSNPFFAVASLIGAFLYNAAICKKRIFGNIKLTAFIIVSVSLFNMLFAHYGNDVLFRIAHTDFTLEALIYGAYQGVVFACVMLWFTALSYNSDGDRVMYLFSFAPKLSLMFSMILGFIPRFNKKLAEIRDAQRGLNGAETPGRIKEKYKSALNNLSALISYSLESSIITADSMSARGYKAGRLSFKRYKLCAQDIVLISIITVLFVFVCYSKAVGNISFIFEPVVRIRSFSVSAFSAFLIIEMIPFFVEMWEEALWKLSSVKA